jgi:DNA polymerase-3 subunit epsilon
MGRCGAPCDGRETVESYAVHVGAVRRAVEGSVDRVVHVLGARIDRLATALRYEEAARHRDRLTTFVRVAARYQRLAALAGCRELVAARRLDDGGFELHVVRRGRLVAAGTVPPGAAPRPYVDALVATAETVEPHPGPTPCATAEEMECVLRWLNAPGVRLVEIDGEWSCPAGGAEGQRSWLEVSRDGVSPFEDRRGLRPMHRPARA